MWILIGVSLAEFAASSTSLAGGTLPQGARYVGGQGAIATSGNSIIVTQPGSTHGVIDWDSFSIGRHDKVIFDNGLGGTLNRVTGGAPSAIFGKLVATGDVFLINPQGIVIGRSGVIATGGRFLASTLDICDDTFMKGEPLTLSGRSNALVINLGSINAHGGDVFLIARKAVVNDGTIAAPNGTVEFAVGEQVLLQYANGSRQVFVQTGSKGALFDTGTVQAAQISLQAADGNIFALAGSGTRLRATGTANRDGHVWLVADGGKVEQSGTIAAVNGDGTGGVVDIQAARLAFGENAQVQASQWNISTPAWTIDPAAANALQRSLGAGTSVNVATNGANGTAGDLNVGSSVRWQGPASLTLGAYHTVTVEPGATVANTGAGNLTLRADASGIDNGGSVANLGTLDWSASTGTVSALYDMTGTYAAGTVLPGNAWTPPPESGVLTQVTGYKLVNALTDLNKVQFDLTGNYALGKDLDVTPPTGTFYAPIGAYPNPFTGQFDGMGHTISNLSIVPSSAANGTDVGMFAMIGTMGVVRNMNVQGNVNGPAASGNVSGGTDGILAGTNLGTIAGVHTSGSVIGPDPVPLGGDITGGLVGFSSGTIMRSSSSADVVAPSGFVGGLVGENHGTVRQSFASGSVDATAAGPNAFAQPAGGLVGYNNAGTIIQSYATGAVTSPFQSSAGALVGLNQFGTIEQSFATGKVQVPGGGAGIAGTNDGPGNITNDVFWNTETTGASVAVLAVSGGAQPGDAQGLTTAQMGMQSSFGATYDFGPQGVWAMPSGATQPTLRWQLAH